MKHRPIFPISILVAVGAAWCFACGPWFPRRVLHTPEATLETPPTVFAEELRRLPERPPMPHTMGLTEKAIVREHWRGMDSLKVDVAEFTRATGDEALAKSYEHWRRAMRPVRNKNRPPPPPPPVAAETVEAFPLEFRLYGEAADLYHSGEHAAAITRWQELLALPAAERQHRSTWAAWMIARTQRSALGDETAAEQSYRQVGELAAAGFADSLELAASATGWLAKFLLEEKRYSDALTLYFHQSLAGDPTAPQSIRITISKILNAEDVEAQLRDIARDPALRGIVTTELLCSLAGAESLPRWGIGNDRTATSHRWLAILDEAGVSTSAEAEQLAWLAYSDADIPLAQAWLAKAPADSGVALWLRAKIALRAGRDREAAGLFKRALPYFPLELDTDPSNNTVRPRKFHADLGAVSLGRSDFLQALSAFLRSGDRRDAAYIAEAVLSAEELLVYVRNRYPTKAAEEFDPWDLQTPDWLRWLLARRLAREQFYKNATDYFPPTWRPVFEEYVAHYRRGVDSSQPDTTRADSLWHAAQIMRKHGMELFGYELWPDAFTYQGSFPARIDRYVRFPGTFTALHPNLVRPWMGPVTGFYPRPGYSERWRVGKSHPPVVRRFHYRHTAADLAWQAAELMPDDHEATARVLCVAGLWLKDRYPDDADRFYKALVRRNPSIPLAQEADKKRWFPHIDWEFRADVDVASN